MWLDSKQKQRRSNTPLGAVSSKMRSSLSKINVSGSMTDLRDILRPQSSLGERTEVHKGPAMKRSASGNVADEEARAAGALQDCLQEVEVFKEQIERFLGTYRYLYIVAKQRPDCSCVGREVSVEQDLTRLVEDRSLHQNGFRRFKGLRETVRSTLQNLYKGLVSVAEPAYVRQEAARGKVQIYETNPRTNTVPQCSPSSNSPSTKSHTTRSLPRGRPPR